MSNDSSLAQPKDIKTRVSERIRETFLELISPEEFDALVQKEIKAFTEDRVESSYGGKATIHKAPLKQMIEEEIRQIFTEELKKELAKPEYQQGMWTNAGYEPSEFVKKLIEENIQEIVKAQYAAMFQSVLIQVKNSLNSMRPYS